MRLTTERTDRRRLRAVGRLGLAATLLIGMAISTGGAGGTTNAQVPPGGSGEPFTDVAGTTLDQARTAADETRPGPDAARSLVLNRAPMEALLAGAPAEGDGSLRIELPAPDGSPMAFDVWQTPIMAPELAAKYPEIRTYGGQGVTDPAASIAFDLTPHGFHAQVLAPSGNWYIDPAVHLADQYHQSFYRDDYTENPYTFVEPNADEIDQLAAERPDPPVASRSGATLRTHRLAMSANQDYTSANGGTRASAMAEIVTSVTRVSGIYQTEMAVRLQLVGNSDQLVFENFGGSCTSGPTPAISSVVGAGGGVADVLVTTAGAHGLAVGDVVYLDGVGGGYSLTWAVSAVPSTTSFRLRGSRFFAAAEGPGGNSRKWNPTSVDCDPFNNLTLDIDVNQAVVDQIIGDANYDIGHVYTTGSGGVAGLGVVGITNQKARGTTGLPAPQGDLFYVDFVAHEMGHQYGGSHTFNGSNGSCGGNQSNLQANRVEPGSGSTIQAYAGICGLDDLQGPGQGQSGDGTNASDPYFNSRSFDEMQAHIATIPGAGTSTPTGNSEPTVDAGSDIFIPARTPFFLGATGSDGDGDALTYNFEQRDGGTAQTGRALDNPEITAGPLFRSFPPRTAPRSFFPRLQELRTGNTNQNGGCPALDGSRERADCWAQFLPPLGTDRDLNFRATVRDNRANSGGVSTDDVVVRVRDTGSKFTVTAPNGGENITDPTIDVTWDVAGTTGAPISASTVSIRLSTDGGLTFPIELLGNTPNDGMHTVPRPNANNGNTRIMVHSGDFVGGSGFFDISNGNFSTTTYAATVPSAPSGVVGTAGDTQVAVSWSAPVTDGGSPITGYTVTASPGGATCSTTGARSCTVTGLTNGTPYTFRVRARNTIGTGPASVASAPVTPKSPTPDVVTVEPGRFLDTRGNGFTIDGSFVGAGKVSGGTFTKIKIAGRGDVPANAVGVEVNITAIQNEGRGFATLYPCTPTVPVASTINYTPGINIANATTVALNSSGEVCLFTNVTAHYALDVVAYVPAGSDVMTIEPGRFLDTRGNGFTIDGSFVGAGKVSGGTFTKVKIAGRGDVPANAVGVEVNITAIQNEGRGFATLYPCTSDVPIASTLNYTPGINIANATTVALNSSGEVCIFSNVTAHYALDVVAFVPAGSDVSTIEPGRFLDTRANGFTIDNQFLAGGKVTGGTFIKVQIAGRGDVPANAVGVEVNITAIQNEGRGFATLYPCTSDVPIASTLNYTPGINIANATTVALNNSGEVCIFSNVTAHYALDVVAYIAA